MDAVGTDDDTRLLRYDGPLRRAPSDPRDSITLHYNFLNGEMLAHFDTGFGCGIHQELIEHSSPWREALVNAILRRSRACQRERTEVEPNGGNQRAAGSRQTPEQSPPMEGSHSRLPNDMR